MIPSWNGLDLLKQFLPSVIRAATHYTTTFDAPSEIVIVDDGSVDDSAAWLHGQGFVTANLETGREELAKGLAGGARTTEDAESRFW
jgi:hypothetical protein